MILRRIATILLLMCGAIAFSSFTGPDGTSIQKIAAQLAKWATINQPEKVYLQFDKPYYAVGDDIWFKAYVTIGGTHQLTALSGALNVELIDDRDSVIRYLKLPMVSGMAWGNFELSDTLSEGNYRVRAYTNHMRNAGKDYFFDQRLIVLNSTTNKILTHTNYTYSSEGGQQKVNATITYTDVNGAPLAGKEVSHVVMLNSKTTGRGKGVTDDKGNLALSFTGQPQQFKSGRIITEIKPADKGIVTKGVLIKSISNAVDIQFFPESGNLVSGITSKIAFKAVGADGLGKEVTGTVSDEQGNTVASFKSTHLGMGVFTLQPKAGSSYKAHLTYADGSQNTVDLPKALDRGYVLSIDNSDSLRLRIKISANHETVIEQGHDTLNLVAQSGGEILYAAKSETGTSIFQAIIPKAHFPSGIVQFTLFSSKGEPLNERLVFIQNPDQIKVDVGGDKQTYAPREKVKLKVGAQTPDGKADEAIFSVSVIDETKVLSDEANENSILASLLLTSDLRGFIERPNYYFANVNDSTRANLDVLMLTQGYRRFEWKKLLSDDIPALTYLPERSIEISGHVTTLNGKPVAHGKVTLMSTMGGIAIIDTVTDDKGRFVFSNLTFRDSIKFAIQARTDKDKKNTQIDLDNITPASVGSNKNGPAMEVNVSDGLSAYMQNKKEQYAEELKYGLGDHVVALKEVVVKEKKSPLKNSMNLNGAGNANQVLTAAQLSPGCITLAQCLEGRLVSLTFTNGKPFSLRDGGPVLVVVDGVNMEPDFLNDINMQEVASVEWLRDVNYLTLYGPGASHGVLVITMKTGADLNYSRPAPGMITYAPQGFYKVKQFYSPQYDDPKTNIPLADLRSTIYWEPNVITDKDGKASFSYFNAGKPGTYRVTIEGIDNDGNLGRKVYRYKVQ